uniref:MANSC domain-containing protein 1 n=1 Tax=Geotrypetes seraphini TaxID=260995 RepID=A0A6P8RT96_GEOSA|nr:MANSC domain-containing protein 1 [Geotrypetes seraphini]XP_033808097.1 MANSC domain-containing protein 1 [Geotrypetes seraphini]XP_033808098.1 MANSC domain-containing protein 1 [Geotrypetes seraphini]
MTKSRENMDSQTNWRCSSVLLLVLYMSPILCTSQQCSTEKLSDLIINITSALSKGVMNVEPVHASTEEACLNLCCSHGNISENKNCNFMTFDTQKAINLPNCYLFYCPTKEACPLKSSIGLVSYKIVKGGRLEADLRLHENSSSSQINSSASKNTAGNYNSNNLQKSISAQILDLAETMDKQLEKIESSHKKNISPNEVEEHERHQNNSDITESFQIKKVSVSPTKAPVAVQPTNSSIPPITLLNTTNQATTTTSQATTSIITTTTPTPQATTPTPQATTTSTITTTTQATTSTPQATTFSITATPKITTIRPSTIPDTTKATTTLTATQPITITTSITTELTSTSSSAVTPTIQLTTRTVSTTYPASNYPVPKKIQTGSLRPSTNLPTTAMKSTKTVSASIPLANINSTGSWKSVNQHNELINSKENQLVNNKGVGYGAISQPSDKSGLVAALCFGVAFLLLIMVLVGRSALESLQRRHYSRLDYLINGMYVDT